MSNTTVKQKRTALKVVKSSKTLNVSSGVFRVNQSITKTINPSISGKSFSSASDSKVLDKSLAQTPKHTVQVFDEHGQDVTPHPLYNPDPGVLQPKQGKIFPAHDTSWTTMTDFPSVAFQTTNASFTGPFTKSFFGSVSASRTSQTTESVTDETKELLVKPDLSSSLSDVQARREEVKEQVREDIMDRVVDSYLTETETIWLLDIPAVSVSEDSGDAEAVKERNNAYTELCKNRHGNDKYVERSMQTFNDAPKTKEVQSDSITMVDKAVMSTTWDMYDSFCNKGDVSENTVVSAEGNKATVPDSSSMSHLLNPSGPDQSMSVFSTTSTVSGSSARLEKMTCVLPVEEEPDLELILQSDKFKQDLAVMERVVLANIFQPKLAAYRQLPVIEDPDCVQTQIEEESWTEQSKNSLSPFLEHLWVFKCELTKGRNVSSMTWNKKNPDLLAVGYGQLDFKDQKPGLVCCWSLKNPTWPDRIFHCESGVTALDFSACNANQLSVGLYDGTIAIYNVQTTEQTPIIDSSDCTNMHACPVWQLRWVDHDTGLAGEDKGEMLISVSGDGRISKWIHYKGLECVDLMKLKSPNMIVNNQRWNPKILSLAPGLCFDFHPNDSKIYLAGTEEGHIHKCSYSYNEQFLETYKAHTGPVYKVTWSPFCPDVFLSCSSDWTIYLWRQELSKPVLGFTSGQKVVFDIMWSPHCATVFGAVREGKVEIWDLRVSSLDPTIVSASSPGVNPTALLFTPETDCVLVGDSEGQVTVYKLKNLPAGDSTQVEVLEDVIQTTLSSQHTLGKTDRDA
ncbi:dynein axonemal intermediate chain 4 [Sinocyclocheilus anshuiensis]|uniref:Dynein axonemal intermediate chain 4 n=1 Tax=Sinocyclocheilus anshuiensis TaxID=1608454 RepID=A0A671TBL8_9TELE|nr:PREDICTED: WD repeat-containing protein 78 [Sinocyclocheilus anshuiensis]